MPVNLPPMRGPSDAAGSAPKPAAAIIPLRDAAAGMEVLLLKRSQGMKAFAGIWAFPGGTTEAADRSGKGDGADLTTARNTAVRELREETGLPLAAAALIPHAHWTTPVGMPYRFATWFFLARAPQIEVHPAPREVTDWCWISPVDALAGHARGALPFLPPVWVALQRLMPFGSVARALAVLAERPPERFRPRMASVDGGVCFLYEEDIAYHDSDLQKDGPRHRLWARQGAWRYDRDAAVS